MKFFSNLVFSYAATTAMFSPVLLRLVVMVCERAEELFFVIYVGYVISVVDDATVSMGYLLLLGVSTDDWRVTFPLGAATVLPVCFDDDGIGDAGLLFLPLASALTTKSLDWTLSFIFLAFVMAGAVISYLIWSLSAIDASRLFSSSRAFATLFSSSPNGLSLSALELSDVSFPSCFFVS